MPTYFAGTEKTSCYAAPFSPFFIHISNTARMYEIRIAITVFWQAVCFYLHLLEITTTYFTNIADMVYS